MNRTHIALLFLGMLCHKFSQAQAIKIDHYTLPEYSNTKNLKPLVQARDSSSHLLAQSHSPVNEVPVRPVKKNKNLSFEVSRPEGDSGQKQLPELLRKAVSPQNHTRKKTTIQN